MCLLYIKMPLIDLFRSISIYQDYLAIAATSNNFQFFPKLCQIYLCCNLPFGVCNSRSIQVYKSTSNSWFNSLGWLLYRGGITTWFNLIISWIDVTLIYQFQKFNHFSWYQNAIWRFIDPFFSAAANNF